MDPKQKLSIDWMYEGPSSSLNREDYLTGRKIDKNFEKSNSHFQEGPSKLDAVVRNKTIGSSSVSKTVAGVSLLDLDTIKKEDPLVAIKVREEQARREILENPVKMKRLKKIVMQSMKKKMMQFVDKRRRRSGSSSSSDSSSSQSDKSRSRSPRFDSKRRHGRRSLSPDKARHRSRRSPDRHSHHRRSTTPKTSLRRNDRERRPSPSPKRGRSNRSPSSSDSETRNSHEKQPGYGLIHFKDRQTSKSAVVPRRDSPKREEKKIESSTRQKKKPAWKPLSEEEMERRRLEMMENAKWRDEQRRTNLKRYAQDEEDQAKRDTKQTGEAVDFIRKMVTSSTDRISIEGNVKSKIQRLQRSAMDSNFARK